MCMWWTVKRWTRDGLPHPWALGSWNGAWSLEKKKNPRFQIFRKDGETVDTVTVKELVEDVSNLKSLALIEHIGEQGALLDTSQHSHDVALLPM